MTILSLRITLSARRTSGWSLGNCVLVKNNFHEKQEVLGVTVHKIDKKFI